MAEVINLRRARKRKGRQQAAQAAAENRIRFGRTPAEKRRDEAAAQESRTRLDLLRREPPPEG